MGIPREGRPIINRNPAIKRMYWIWWAMIARCHKPVTKQFADYGGRGIVVCDRWRADFWSFYDDMAPRPPGRSLMDRIDNNKGYSPANCRWVYFDVSNCNRRYCILKNGNALKKYMRDTGQEDRYRMVAKRIRKGMSVDEALARPARTWPGPVHS